MYTHTHARAGAYIHTCSRIHTNTHVEREIERERERERYRQTDRHTYIYREGKDRKRETHTFIYTHLGVVFKLCLYYTYHAQLDTQFVMNASMLGPDSVFVFNVIN